MMGELFHLDLQKEMQNVLVSMCLSPVIFMFVPFLFMPTYSGMQLGCKTRGGCILQLVGCNSK
jgi:hypothetical protein